MGSCCCKKNIVKDYFKKDQNLDFDVQTGKIICYDESSKVPMAKIDFNGFYNSFVRIWPIRDFTFF